jgi:hypothetical protein
MFRLIVCTPQETARVTRALLANRSVPQPGSACPGLGARSNQPALLLHGDVHGSRWNSVRNDVQVACAELDVGGDIEPVLRLRMARSFVLNGRRDGNTRVENQDDSSQTGEW